MVGPDYVRPVDARRRRRSRRPQAGKSRSRATTRRAASGGRPSATPSSNRAGEPGRGRQPDGRRPPRPGCVKRRPPRRRRARSSFPVVNANGGRVAQRRADRAAGNAQAAARQGITNSYNVALDLKLGDRSVGRHPPRRRGERRHAHRRARRPRGGDAVGAGTARAGLSAAARAGRGDRSCCAKRWPPTSARCSSRRTSTRPASSRAATWRRPRRSSSRRRRRSSTRSVARAQLEHAIAVLVGKPPAELSIAAQPLATTFPQIPVGAPVGAARAAARHRGCRTPHRQRERPDRRRAGGVLPGADAVGATAACRAR